MTRLLIYEITWRLNKGQSDSLHHHLVGHFVLKCFLEPLWLFIELTSNVLHAVERNSFVRPCFPHCQVFVEGGSLTRDDLLNPAGVV